MPRQTAITIGSFDGVHLGHVALIRAARSEVGKRGRVLVLSFDPHPATILRPQSAPARLSSLDQRSAWLKEAGADDVMALTPSPQFLAQSPAQFIESIVAPYQPAIIVEGPDFRFGKQRAGSVQTLREMETRFKYRTIVVDPIAASLTDQSIVTVSSTMVRWLLERGRVRDAKLLLARQYEIRAAIISGDKRGRTIGVPTINLNHQDYLLPADGIYSGTAIIPSGDQFPAAISVGTKPTFGTHPRLCEAHLIGYHGPLDDYDWVVQLRFHEWVRDQLKYDHVDQLVAQLQRDVKRCSYI